MGDFGRIIQPVLGTAALAVAYFVPITAPYLAPLGISLLLSSGIGEISRAIAPKPSPPQEFDLANIETARRGRTVAFFEATAARDIVYGEVMKSGPIMPIALTGDENEYFHFCLLLAGHEIEDTGDLYFGDRLHDPGDPDWASHVDVRVLKGTANQAADPIMLEDLGPIGWSAKHRLRGVAYLYVVMKWDPDFWPAGFPNIKIVVKGKKPFGSWTENAASCIYDYMTDSDLGMGIPAAKINSAAFSAAQTICDQTVVMQGGGSPAPTQKRYTLNGSISTESKPIDVLEQMLTAMAGTMVYFQGEYHLYAGAYDSPTVTLTEDNLRGPITVHPRPSRKDRFNAVRGLFPKKDDLWEIRDFPPVTNATYEAEDGGDRLYMDVQLPFTDDPVRAQRIAKIMMERHRQSVTCEFPANMTAHRLAPWDTVMLDIDQLGWSSKVFRVLTWDLAPGGGIDLTLQEEASAVYDWNAEETVLDPAPNTNLPNPYTVGAPGTPSVVESLYATRDSTGVKARATVSWMASSGPFVVAYQLEHRLVGESTWRIEPRVAGTSADINDIEPGNTEFRVKAINSLNVSSAYSNTLTQEISGLSTPPSAPQNLSLSAIGGMAILRWDPSTDLDVRIGGKWLIRHSKETSGAAWNQAYTIGTALSGSESVAVLPLKAGTYLVRAEDAIGVLGTVASVTTKQATILAYTTTNTVTEHTSSPPFSGTKSNLVVDTGNLKIDLTGSPVVLTGTYGFAAGIDFGSVVRRRLTSDISLLISNETDLIDSRTSNIDTWESFDGDVDGRGDAELQYRETDDNPAGSPVTWSDWKRFDSVEVEARGVEFQAVLSVEDAAYNVLVDELAVTADQI